MTAYMKRFIEYHFHGDVLAFRCYCLTHHVEPRKGSRGCLTPYGFYTVPMAERRGLAKRLILMTQEVIRDIRIYRGYKYVKARPSLDDGLTKILSFWRMPYYSYFEEDGYYISLTNSPKGHLKLNVIWQQCGEVWYNTVDPFCEEPGRDRRIFESAISFLVSKNLELDQFIKIG